MALLRAYYAAYQGLPRMVWLLAVLLFVSNCGSMVLPFLTIYLVKAGGYTAADAVQFFAVYGCGGILGAYLGGTLSRHLGPLRVLTASLLLRAPAYLVIPLCESPWQLVAALLWLSIAGETSRPATTIATADHCNQALLTRSFALNRLAANLGFAIGPAIGGLLAARGLWVWLFRINALAALASAVAALAFFGLGRRATQTARPAAVRGVGSPWADGHYLAFLGLQLMGGLVFFQILSTFPVYLAEQQGLSEDQIGSLFVINTLLIVLLEMVVTDRLKHCPAIRMVAVGTSLVCVGFGGAVFGRGYLLIASLTVVWTAGEMLSAPFAITHAACRARGRNREAYLGLNSMVFAVSAVAAPLVGSVAYRIHPNLTWWCSLALAALLPAGFLGLERSANAAGPPPQPDTD